MFNLKNHKTHLMSDEFSKLCEIVDKTQDYFKTDVGKKKLKLLDYILYSRDPTSGIESTFTSVIAQVIDNMSDLVCETRFTGEDVVVYDQSTLPETFKLELQAGIQSIAPIWYTEGAKQFPGTHCIFMGPIGLLEKITPDCYRKIGNWVIGVIT
jgi:hypothetical protein